MNRRNFLKNTSLAGIALTSITLASANNNSKSIANDAGISAIPEHDFALSELTIDELQRKMESKELSSRSITEMYLKRIDEIDKKGPSLNTIIELNPEALSIAETMDLERKAGKIRGPMHGIPVLIKDNINTGDRMMTTAGSLALADHIAVEDAFIIKQLRAAGAVLLGKTNLSEWANFRSSRSASGWSSRGGQTKNPCVLDRNPSGSSAGSGAAVSANLTTVTIGTETNGSITAPASYNGIVGIKPTVGLLSRNGIIPISITQDTAGPMARTVKDAAILLGALTGIDSADAAMQANKAEKDYTRLLSKEALKGKRIGIETSFYNGHEGVVELYRKAIELIKKQGAEIVEIELLNLTKALGDAEFTVLKFEFKDGLNKYLSKANAKVKSLADVIAFNKKNEDRTMPYFKQDIMEDSEKTTGLESKEYKDALEKVLSSRKIIDDLMMQHQLDAISGVTIGLPCCIDLVNGDYDTGFYFGSPAAMAGYPHITVPMGKVHELPVGFSFTSKAYTEAALLSFAYAFEQASLKRETPKFLKTAIVI